MSGEETILETAEVKEQIRDNLQQDTSRSSVGAKILQDEVESRHKQPNTLEQQKRELNQYIRGHEPISAFMAGTGIFTLVSFFMPPVYTVAALSSNAIPAYAHKKVLEATEEQREIDNELEN